MNSERLKKLLLYQKYITFCLERELGFLDEARGLDTRSPSVIRDYETDDVQRNQSQSAMPVTWSPRHHGRLAKS